MTDYDFINKKIQEYADSQSLTKITDIVDTNGMMTYVEKALRARNSKLSFSEMHNMISECYNSYFK